MSDNGESNEIVNEFLVESYEGLDQLDLDLVELEQCGGNAELIGRVFRCVHTIKGTCGFLGFGKLESVAHVGENLLSKVRDGSIGVSPDLTSALLRLNDALRGMLTHIEAHGLEGETDHSDLIATLVRLTDANAAPYVPPTEHADAGADEGDEAIDDQELAGALELPAPASLLGSILVDQGSVINADIAAAMHEQAQTGQPRVGEILVARGATTTAAVKEALETQQDVRAGHVSDGSIRVDVALLDRLMNLVGELVLARNQILQCTATNADSTLNSTTQRLNLITSELQEGVMKTRMQPIGNIWSKFPRVVRDLAVTCSKQVTIQMEGAETELDKTIIEAIKDPLTHIVRNSIDHGIESPRDRVLNDKSPEGRLLLRAFHEGGQVNIEITDDGAGIDPARLRSKAVEKGLLTAEAAARLSDREAMHLIFAAGFSTAAKVTNVSGRGVGMDVVKTNIEKIGGTVDVTSTIGAGTTLRIKIPLTLAIIPGLIITSGGERFAIPQVSLLELVRMEHEEAKQRVEMIYDSPVYRLRGKLLPLVHLSHALGLGRKPWPHEAGAVDEPLNIVVLQTDGISFGLVVDQINDTEEIVVKPLGKQLKGITTFAGATIMGDGKVALILDVHGLAQRAGVLTGDRDRNAADQRNEQRSSGEPTQTLLLFGFGGVHRMALPLSEIARLEEFAPDIVEHTGRYDVVQYRDRIMPLVRLSEVLEGVASNAADGDMLQVIVYAHEDQYVGLVVDRILDIVESTVKVQRRRRAGTVLGSAVIQDKVTDILDIRHLIHHVEEDFLATSSAIETREVALHG
jgi:two-component system chemotaxis sensor kinase CheA